MPKRYAREFRRAVCERLVAGEKASVVSRDIEDRCVQDIVDRPGQGI
jgi:hypothetical protein